MSDDVRNTGFPPDDPSDRLLDAAVDALAASGPTAEESAAARRRAWERLQASLAAPQASADCAGVVADLDAYQQGTLPAGRAALVRDHLGECLPCRRAARTAHTGPPTIRRCKPSADRRRQSLAPAQPPA